MADGCTGGSWQEGVPEGNGDDDHTFSYFPWFPHSFGYYASPLETTDLMLSPIRDDTGSMVKRSEEFGVVVGEPINVAGGSSDGGEAIDRLKRLGGEQEQPESDELRRAMVPLVFQQSIMVQNGALKNSPMDHPPMRPDLAHALESRKKFSPEAMEEQITRDPPTRRRVSARRTFPYGCGRHAPILTQLEVENLRARAQRGKASSSEVREAGVSSGAKRACGRGISTSMGNFDYVERASGDRNGKGSPVGLAKAASWYTVKAIVGAVDKGKASLMCEKDLPHVGVKCALQRNTEMTIQCDKKWSLQQFEECSKFIDYGKMKPEQTDSQENVKRILQHFKLLQDKDSRTKFLGRSTRPDLQILGLLKEKGMTPAKKYLGAVPGVQIGDQFHYRGELMAIGLHCAPVAGIDCTLYKGLRVAACIISSGGYVNSIESPDVFIYSGEGGNPDFERKRKRPPGDQKLERGNLALKNSRDTQTPVRVIHGLRDTIVLKSDVRAVGTYVYDGLYKVEKFWLEMGQRGYRIFKFQLRRMPGQPESALKRGFVDSKSRTDSDLP